MQIRKFAANDGAGSVQLGITYSVAIAHIPPSALDRHLPELLPGSAANTDHGELGPAGALSGGPIAHRDPDLQRWFSDRSLGFMVPEGGARGEVLSRIAALIRQRLRQGTLRVAIDGIDAAGKTTLADELAELLEQADCPVLRASIDGFHHPSSVRHLRADEQPAQSYYEDSFDYRALRALLLDPLGPDGDHLVRTRVFDFRADLPVEEAPIRVQPGTVVLFDGVFLLRPELQGCWDLSVFVQVDRAVSLLRASRRDVALFGNRDAAERRYRDRYLPGQELYISQVHPDQEADVLIGNNDLASPELLRIPPA